MYDSDLSNEEWAIIEHHLTQKIDEEMLINTLKNSL